ncbi:MAG: DUF255 domain-containing protein [Candidatus Omnitrophica bacterium]|nr:DUF255 domain-containing protein [Candidatus Omnitrophota bacterium]
MNADSGNPATFLGVFLLGLGLNLTPCVYPLLAVTVSLFSSRKEEGKTALGLSFLRALIYVLGMAVTNTTLAVIAALTGGLLGAILQNTWVLLVISLLLFGLALSLFGVYTIQAPSWILNRISGKRSTSLVGLFVSGLIVGIFAAPCIGPPVLALLTWVGALGNPAYAVLVFFTLSLGLGLPYLVLGTFSGLVSKLPKSGVWLLWMERFFGVILLALAAFYGILALHPAFLKWLAPISLAAGGIYLGFLERSANDSGRFNDFRKVFGVLAITAGFMLPFLSPKTFVEWELYSPEKLEASARNKRPVILDFYADWCIPCHELDQVTYADPKVIQALKRFDKYKVNLTDQDTDEAGIISEEFGLEGVPTIVFLGVDGKERGPLRVAGFISPEELLPLIQQVPSSDSVQEVGSGT